MKIETKFDIGDVVWIIWIRYWHDVTNGNYEVKQTTIKNISIRIESYEFPIIVYNVNSSECNVFKTEAEAIKEAERRNGGGE